MGRVMRELGGNALYVVVPRHAERRLEVKEILESCGFEVILRSLFNPPHHPANTCLVVDSTGELRDWTAHADVVVIGKSFLGYGGQNPAEAIAAGVPVIAGPHMQNFEPLSTMLKQAGGMVGLSSRGELGDAIQHLLAGTNDEMVGVARQVLETHQGANRRTVEWLRIG